MYQGNSIVDYLKSVGQDASYGNRSNMYASAGLNMGNYSGSAAQNTALLTKLRSGGGQPAAQPSVASPQPSAPSNVGSAKSNLDDSRQKLIDHYANLEDPITKYNNLSKEQGIPQQQDLVNTLTKNVMNVEDDIESTGKAAETRSSNFFFTEDERSAFRAKEQTPLFENLNKLLKNKQYEEIGLSGKMNLVNTLLSLSQQGDENRAKPLQLGVDFSQQDYDIAQKLMQDETNYQRELSLKKTTASASTNKKAALQKTEDVWNEILGGSKSEYDVWSYINKNQDNLRSKGIDVDSLWSMHKALTAKVGQGGSVRSESNSSKLNFLNED